MKIVYSVFFFLFMFVTGYVKGQTNVSGLISSDALWTKANSPYVITGNTLVLSGVTLTIEPGCEIRFNSGTILQVAGNLIANGTADNHIVFTANTDSPYKGYWNYIYLTGSNSDYYPANAPVTSFFDYCDASYGGSGGRGTIRVEKLIAKITNSTITQSSSAGMTFSRSPTTVKNCNISYNEGDGLTYDNDPFAATTIDHDTISKNAGTGISFPNIGIFDLFITNNTIQANASGIFIDQGGGSGATKVYIQNNLIDGNNGSERPSAISIGQGFHMYITGNTITNNVSSSNYLIRLYYGWNPYINSIRDNYIANNTATSGGLMYFYYNVSYNGTTFDFLNNKVLDNAAPYGSIFQFLGNNGAAGFNFNISNNTIMGNSGGSTFLLWKFQGHINNNTIYDSVNYEINNQNAAAEPTVDAKNNFWNRTRGALDNYVYDFFDDGNLSLVLLDPLNMTLPMHLVNFTVERNGGSALLHWQASKETNIANYVVERKAGDSFVSIGSIAAKGNNQGGVFNYSFTDSLPVNGINYYRVKTMDADGRYTYSDIVPVTFTGKHVSLSLYPNPASTYVIVEHKMVSTPTRLMLVDMQGRKLKTLVVAKGSAQTRIDLPAIAKGIYKIVWQQEGKTTESETLLIQ